MLMRSLKSVDTLKHLLKRADKVLEQREQLKRADKLGEQSAYSWPTFFKVEEASKLKKFVERQHRVTSLVAEPTPMLSFACQHGSEFVCVCVCVCVWCVCVMRVYTYTK